MSPNISSGGLVVNDVLIPSGQVFPMLINTNIQYPAKGNSDYNTFSTQLWSLVQPIATNGITADIDSDGITVKNIVGNVTGLQTGRLVVGAGIPSNTFVDSIDTINNTFVLTKNSAPANGIAITISRHISSNNVNDFNVRDLFPDISNGNDYDYVFTKSDGTTIDSGNLEDYIFDKDLAFSKNGLVKDSFQIRLHDVKQNIPVDGTVKIRVARATKDCSYIPVEFYDGARPQDLILAREVFNIWSRIQEIVYKIATSYFGLITSGITNIVNFISDAAQDAYNTTVAGSRYLYTRQFQALEDSLPDLPRVFNYNFKYRKYAIVRDPDSPEQYISRIDNNKNHPLNDNTSWTKIDNLPIGEYHVVDSDYSYWENHDMYIKNPIGQVLAIVDYPLLFAHYGSDPTDVNGNSSPTGQYFKLKNMQGKKRVCQNDNVTDGYQTAGNSVGHDTQTAAHNTFREYPWPTGTGAGTGLGGPVVVEVINQPGSGYDVPAATSNSFDNRDQAIVNNYFLKAKLI